jgi:hypothetical protein
MLMLFSAVTFAFTSCSNKVEEDEGDTSEAVDGEEEDTSDEEEDTSDSDSTTAAADGDGSTFAWSDVLND